MHMTKMQGLGNDYLYIYGEVADPVSLSIKYSDRHFGVGSDGIILVQKSAVADFKMRIFNADGSEAKMCGNGIRCVGKYVYDKGYTDKTRLTIETLSGIRTLELTVRNGKVVSATVNMGKVTVCEPVTLTVCGQALTTTPVSVGNPHTVTFIPDAENAPLTTVGAALEHDAFFPEGVNAEFAQVLGENDLRMRVWERGSGITMACGTGACATAAAAVKAGYCKIDEDISVRLDGGTLHIRVLPDYTVMMTGPAATVCECEVDE
ncbi:MAG: diaminopimelate epimerase [Oscillospiraceae bacterium]|nr:diaminopimelate epimerase [Oscillospiraceae bacterium]